MFGIGMPELIIILVIILIIFGAGRPSKISKAPHPDLIKMRLKNLTKSLKKNLKNKIVISSFDFRAAFNAKIK